MSTRPSSLWFTLLLVTSCQEHPGAGSGTARTQRQELRSPELSFGPFERRPPAAYQFSPTVGFDGTQYWVAWQSWNRARTCEVLTTRVSMVDGGTSDRYLPLLRLDTVGCAVPRDLDFDGRAMALSFDFYGESGSAFSVARFEPISGGIRAIVPPRRPGVFPHSLSVADAELLTLTSDGLAVSAWRRFPDAGVSSTAATVTSNTGLVPNFTETPARIDLAWDGTRALAVWMDTRLDQGDVRATWLDRFGTPITSAFPVASTSAKESHCRVAAGGNQMLVVWQEELGAMNKRVRGSIVSFGGGAGPAFDIAASGVSDSIRPTVAFSGGVFVVAWLDNRYEVRASRVSTGGAVLNPGGVLVSTDAEGFNGRVVITSGPGSRSLLVWSSRALTFIGTQLEGATPITPTPFAVHLTAPSQRSPSLAAGADGTTLMAWVDNQQGGASELYQAFLTADGGGQARLVARGNFEPVSTASNGSTYWLATARDFTAEGRLLTPGTIGPPITLALVPSASRDVVTIAEPSSFLTIWSDGRGGVRQVYGRRSFVDGGLGPELQLTNGGITKSTLAMARNAAGVVLIVWGPDGSNSVEGLRFVGDVPLDAQPVRFGGAGYFLRPTVATDGTDFLVAWEENDLDTDVLGRFVGPSGPPGPVFPIAATAAANHFPTAIWDGRDFVLTWESDDDVFIDVYAATVARDGGIGPRVPLAAVPGETEIMGRLAPVGPGRWWFAWSRFDATPDVASLRVHAQQVFEDVDAGRVDAGQAADSGVMDAGAADAGRTDAGMMGVIDAGLMDAGTTGGIDAGVTDGGMTGGIDAGVTDAGMTGVIDAGVAAPDAGATDAGLTEPDAGAPDAGVVDAGLRDGGATDARTSDGGIERPTFSVGVGCSVASLADLGSILAVLVVLGCRRSR